MRSALQRRLILSPEADFGGYKFRVAHWQFGDRPAYDNRDLIAETETGDRINDAVYKRNMVVMDKYNFTLELTNISYEQHNPEDT